MTDGAIPAIPEDLQEIYADCGDGTATIDTLMNNALIKELIERIAKRESDLQAMTEENARLGVIFDKYEEDLREAREKSDDILFKANLLEEDLREANRKCEWRLITEQDLPKVGDEVYGVHWRNNSLVRDVEELDVNHRSKYPKYWDQRSHFRPINPPTQEAPNEG